MKIVELKNSSIEDLARHGHDLAIVASGFETRARSVAEILGRESVRIQRKRAWGFVEYDKALARCENDRILNGLGYTFSLINESDSDMIRIGFENELRKIGDQELSIIIDISSMTRAWYGAIVHCLTQLMRRSRLKVSFVYTAAEYCDPPIDYPPNEIFQPVPGFSSFAFPDRPTGLILGLGYHRDRALGLQDHLDPQLTQLFYSNPGSDPRFCQKVLEVNEQLIDIVGKENLFRYPIFDCVATFNKVHSATVGLLRKTRVVLSSLGPKSFGLTCFLVAACEPEVSIWRVSAGPRNAPVDSQGADELGVFEVLWE